MRMGSLFTGSGGLDCAVAAWFGARTVWTSDIDPGACKIIAHRMPHAPNLGDITAIDWTTVEPIDVLTGGFPCQDLSHAGKRLGLKPGTRSGLWSHMAYAISQLRPRFVVAENVRGLLSASADSDVEPCPWCLGGSGNGEPDLRALGAVLGDLASLGYVGSWIGLRAADVGAPHGRFRVFVVAADTERGGRDGRAGKLGQGRREQPANRGDVATDAYEPGPQGTEPAQGRDVPRGSAFAHPESDGRDEGRTEPAWLFGRPHAALSGHAAPDTDSDGQPGKRWLEPIGRDADRRSRANVSWGAYEPATPGGLDAYATETGPDQVLRDLRATETGPDQVLRDLRRSDVPQEVREAAGGPRGVPAQEAMRAVVREHQEDCDEGREPLACQKAPQDGMRGMQRDGQVARPPHRSESSEQRPHEPADALRFLSPETALAGGPGQAHGRCGEGKGYGCSAWGQYAPAIHRWEIRLGRLAPSPTEAGPKGGRRLSARAVEFMMGLPSGWVTDVPGLSRNAQLKALGNGVVPQQAYEALRRAFALEAAA